MKKYIFIGILGMFGAMSRYAIKSIDVSVSIPRFISPVHDCSALLSTCSVKP